MTGKDWAQIISLVSILAFYLMGFTLWQGWRCSTRWADTGHVAEFSIPAGCRINVDGRWIPEDSYRESGNAR